MKPTLGRIIHYLEDGHVFAGLIVHVKNEVVINLVFWNPHGMQFNRQNVPFSKDIAKHDKHWFWPPMPKVTPEDLKRIQAEAKKFTEHVKSIAEEKPK